MPTTRHLPPPVIARNAAVALPSTLAGRVVAVMLAGFTRDDWTVWASVGTLAHKSRLSRNTIRRALATLIRDGLLEVAAGHTPNNATLYRWTDAVRGYIADPLRGDNVNPHEDTPRTLTRGDTPDPREGTPHAQAEGTSRTPTERQTVTERTRARDVTRCWRHQDTPDPGPCYDCANARRENDTRTRIAADVALDDHDRALLVAAACPDCHGSNWVDDLTDLDAPPRKCEGHPRARDLTMTELFRRLPIPPMGLSGATQHAHAAEWTDARRPDPDIAERGGLARARANLNGRADSDPQ